MWINCGYRSLNLVLLFRFWSIYIILTQSFCNFQKCYRLIQTVDIAHKRLYFLTLWKIWGYMGAFCEKYAVIIKISTYFVLKPQYFHKIEFMWPIDAIWWKTTIYRYNKTKIYLLNVWKMWLHPAISTWGVFGFLYKNVNQSLFYTNFVGVCLCNSQLCFWILFYWIMHTKAYIF